MNKLIIGCPFGNYLQWTNCTSTLGTFTREYRGGFWKRIWRVLRTVRYYRGIKAWKNKLGLPNPGIDWLAGNVGCGRINVSDKIVSVSARNTSDWIYLLDVCRYLICPLAVELNVSCPNTPGEIDTTDYEIVYARAAAQPYEVIVKIPPVNYEHHVSLSLSQGVSSFHCCNTLSTPGGGLSGKPLMSLSLSAVRYVTRYRLKRVIGGGGITHQDDVQRYLDAGVTNVSVASVLFNPFAWKRIQSIARSLLT